MPAAQRKRTLAEESLNQAAVGTSITSADVESLPYGHRGYNRVEEQRRNLGENSECMRLDQLSRLQECLQRSLFNGKSVRDEWKPKASRY